MQDWRTRTELLIGEEKLSRLCEAHVLIVGLGGVGAYAAEMLCRSGVGQFTLVDSDEVNESNLNRQLIALRSTIGQAKTKILEARLRDINPSVQLTTYTEYVNDDRIVELLSEHPYDYVIDAIDTLSPKTLLLIYALQKNMKVISSMGAGAKMDPSHIMIKDISKSYNCKLARMLRKKLYKHGIRKGIKVVFSSELPDKEALFLTEDEQNKRSVVGTISYMPAIFGCMMAAEVIKDLTTEASPL